MLDASGTAQGIGSGRHLWLFLEWHGVSKYWAGEPKLALRSGHWSGAIDIGDPGYLVLWLVNLNPEACKVMSHDGYYQRNGFPCLHFTPGVMILRHVDFIAQ
jgi:hypothetical protein